MNTLRLLPKFLASLLLVPLTTFFACTPEVRQYGGDGGGGSNSSSSSSGGICTSDADCGANSECQSFGCVDGACAVSFTPMNTPVGLQEMGDCQSKVCDGKGYIVDVPDLADTADDGNPCTLEACVDGQTQHGYLMAGMACDGSRLCDGFGYCVECLDNSQCAAGVCTQNTCAAPECSDTVKNGNESDIDCGGGQCPGCPVGNACAIGKDCKSAVCENGACVAPTCMDNVANGQETYIDCGGPDCMPCKDGAPCNAGLDCLSHVCTGNVCQVPACDDMISNGNETDIDCGGSMCPKCPLGRACNSPVDCASSHCCIPDGMPPGYCISPMAMCNAVLRSEVTQ